LDTQSIIAEAERDRLDRAIFALQEAELRGGQRAQGTSEEGNGISQQQAENESVLQ
jgi:hypothetical protein